VPLFSLAYLYVFVQQLKAIRPKYDVVVGDGKGSMPSSDHGVYEFVVACPEVTERVLAEYLHIAWFVFT
jgi:hypothetical protein